MNADELFEFVEFDDSCTLSEYLKTNDPSVTELEIPEEYNGKPVKSIEYYTFFDEKYLKSVKLPKSLIVVGGYAFGNCPELERVEFNSAPDIGLNVFGGCPKLPLETVVMGLVSSTDITTPISYKDFLGLTKYNPNNVPCDIFRPDVFELLLKNDCFRDCDLKSVFCGMIDHNNPALFPTAEQYGLLEDAELLDTLTEYSAEQGKTEITAYLLELKKRKFGFNGGNDFEL